MAHAGPASTITRPSPGSAFGRHVGNLSQLVIKELRSIRADPLMLILVLYAFTIAVYTVTTGASTEVRNMPVGFVDEDHSSLSRQLGDALLPPLFKGATSLSAAEMDVALDRGRMVFVVVVPPKFEADVLAGHATSIQINVDATAMAQAGNGANYIQSILTNEISNFRARREGGSEAPVNLVIRSMFNPNMMPSWFNSVVQVINSLTMLTIILSGAALIREREQGTVEHLLVMPVVPRESMLAKVSANAPVVRRGAGRPLGGRPVANAGGRAAARRTARRLAGAVHAGRGALCMHGGGAWHPARHGGDHDGAIRAARDPRLPGVAAAVGQYYPDGKHAAMAQLRDAGR